MIVVPQYWPSMPNHLPIEKQIKATHALAEGASICSIERQEDIHRDTIMRLGVRIGQKCALLLDQSMRGLECRNIQVDEIWGFVKKKARNVTPEDDPAEVGDAWTYVAMCADTKLVPSHVVGKRDYEHTTKFTQDLASRMKNRFQLSTDGMNQYLATVDEAFGDEVDYGQIVKVYTNHWIGNDGERRYSPQPFVKEVGKKAICGAPDFAKISTSHVERQNLTMRTFMKRMTRLTCAFSKKMENHKAAVALYFAYYNFVKLHKTLRCTPAMAAKVTNRLWTVKDLILWTPN